jgi:hypothetical protein
MPPTPPARNFRRRSGKSRRRRSRPRQFWSGSRLRKRWWPAFRRAPASIKWLVGGGVLLLAWFFVNGLYQVVRKPSELFFPVSGVLYRTPTETWSRYAPIFREHATRVVTAELLAAFAQVEASGNPVARTYWRWSWTLHPLEMYRPASSAVGMYQITDGNFAEARRYCIHDHVVVVDGPWSAWHSCWFNNLYARVIPSHAVELTAAYLDLGIANIVARHHRTSATQRQKQQLGAVIHLCGAGAGDLYAQRGFRLLGGQRCGDHEVRDYLVRIDTMLAVFTRLAQTSQ